MFLNWETIILFTITVVLLYFHFERKVNYWRRRGVNGPKALPIIGNLLDNFRMAQNELEQIRYQKYGRVYGVMQGTKPVLTIGDPELLQQIMITDFRVFMNHRDNFEADPFLGRFLTELKNDEWKRVRAIMSRAFTTGKIKAMQPLIENCIKKTFKYLDSKEKSNEEIDTKKMTMSYTLDVIASCVFGVDTNASQNPNEEFVVKARELVDFPLWRVLTKVVLPGYLQVKYDLQLFPKKHTQYFKTLLGNVIRRRREYKTDYIDFVTLLLNAEYKEENDTENNKHLKVNFKPGKIKLTENDIVSNCILFFIAGYETTGTFLHFTLYALATHPNIQQKLFDEIKEYSKDHETIEFDSLNSLPYFEAVCKESMRLYTPITIFEHICGETYKLGDIVIEKGVIINLPLYAMHHDSELFPDPYKFIPERFLPENRDSIKPYSFIPFALGPRICIGNRFSNFHSKLFLANLIKNYEIVTTKNTHEKPKYNGKFLFLSCEPIFIAIRRRK